MKKSYVFLLLVGLALVVLLGYYLKTGSKNSQSTGPKKIQITTSFYPLFYTATQVGGDFVEVKNITPAGSEPHDYEPTPRDIASIYDSDLFIYNGNGLDAWADNIRTDLESRGVVVIKMSENFNALKSISESGIEEKDPHIWLDPINMQKEADLVASSLAKIDNSHVNEYGQNRDAFKQSLSELDQEYRDGLANCQLREIVTSHNAFNYLGNRYDFTSFYILGFSLDEEPSPKKIAEIADLAKQKNIKYIFFETLVNPKLSQTIAAEIGANTLVLNPIEGLTDDEIAKGESYISVMKENLANLRTALVCQ